MGRRNNSTLVAERVRRICKRLGIVGEELMDRERQELRLRFATVPPATRLRSQLIAAKISAATIITPISAAVIVHLDVYEEQPSYTPRPSDEAA